MIENFIENKRILADNEYIVGFKLFLNCAIETKGKQKDLYFILGDYERFSFEFF